MASLLETFYILFDSNADKVKQGTDTARNSSDELEQSLGRTDRQASALGDHFLGTITQVAAGLAAAFGIQRIASAVLNVAELNEKLGETAHRLGIAVSDIASFEQASMRAGGERGGFINTLDFLNRGLADISTKGTSRLKPFFDELDIRVTDGPKKVRPLLDIIRDLADKLSVMDKQRAAGIGEKLGIDVGTLMLMQSGRRALDDLVERQRALGVATEEDARIADTYHDSMQDLDQVLDSVYTRIGSAVLPALTDFLKWVMKIVEYLGHHQKFVEGFFIGVGAVIGTYYLPAIVEAAIATIVAIGPYLLLAAAVLAVGAAFALVYDDIDNFLKGNKSVIGELKALYPETFAQVVEWLEAAGEAVRWFANVSSAWFGLLAAVVREDFGAIMEIIRELTVVWKALDATFSGTGKRFEAAFPLWAQLFGVFGDAVEKHITNIVHAVEWLIQNLDKILNWFSGHSIGGEIGGWLRSLGGNVLDTLWGAAGGRTPAALAAGHDALNTVSLTPFNASGNSAALGAGGNSRTLHVNIDRIDVASPAGTDPDAFGRGVADSLQNHLRQATNQFDDGVEH